MSDSLKALLTDLLKIPPSIFPNAKTAVLRGPLICIHRGLDHPYGHPRQRGVVEESSPPRSVATPPTLSSSGSLSIRRWDVPLHARRRTSYLRVVVFRTRIKDLVHDASCRDRVSFVNIERHAHCYQGAEIARMTHDGICDA